MKKLSYVDLTNALDYQPETGVFTWKKSKSGIRSDKIAGCLTSAGYIFIGINRQRFLAHRLAWFYVYGEMPSGVIDHINRIKTDNRICNLRDVTQVENGQNNKLSCNNSTGANGVRRRSDGRARPWNARVMHKGQEISIGHFKTFEEACEARKNWDKNFWETAINRPIDGI